MKKTAESLFPMELLDNNGRQQWTLALWHMQEGLRRCILW